MLKELVFDSVDEFLFATSCVSHQRGIFDSYCIDVKSAILLSLEELDDFFPHQNNIPFL